MYSSFIWLFQVSLDSAFTSLGSQDFVAFRLPFYTSLLLGGSRYGKSNPGSRTRLPRPHLAHLLTYFSLASPAQDTRTSLSKMDLYTSDKTNRLIHSTVALLAYGRHPNH
jgi:hypothetical protein